MDIVSPDEKGFIDGYLSIGSPIRSDGLEYVSIEVEDAASGVHFLNLRISRDNMMKALQRQSSLKCKMEVAHLDKVGKKMEHQEFVFGFPDDVEYRHRDALAVKMAWKLCPKGWEPDIHFGSKNSFFTENGKSFARTTIRRWV